jgi:acyl-CoA dehydrogenase
VPWGGTARHLVVVGEVEGRAMVALVAGGRARVALDRNVALEPRDTLEFAGAAVEAAAPAAAGVPANAPWVYGALARSAQMAGALESILAQAVRYATERKQFGRAIGAFQAIQHQLAVLAGHTAAAGMAAAQACRVAERGDPLLAVAAAKVRVGEAAGFGAGIAHQVHGAIGFTYEHSLHFSTRRLWSWRAEFGGESHWAAVLGRHVAARGPARLWADLTAR